MCGEMMHVRTSETVVQVPGNPIPKPQVVREWVCSDCDYFEEVELERT